MLNFCGVEFAYFCLAASLCMLLLVVLWLCGLSIFVVLVVFAVDRLGIYALSRHLKAISMVLNFEFPIMLITTGKKKEK